MARGINKVILVGNLGQDVDMKYTQSGMAVGRTSLATTSVRKDRDGNATERTEWHRLVFFGKLAEIAGEYASKGTQLYVEGELRYEKYTGQDGQEKYATDIVVNELQLLGGRGGRDSDGGGQSGSAREGYAQRGHSTNGGQQSARSYGSGRDRQQQRGSSNAGGANVGRGGTPARQRHVPQPVPAEDAPYAEEDIPFINKIGLF